MSESRDAQGISLLHGYSARYLAGFRADLQRLLNETPGVQFNLHELSQRLTVPRARQYASEGMGRRLPLLQRAVVNIFRVYPPDRRDFLTKDECSDVAIQFQAFAVNLWGLFDNVAWVCMLEAGGALNRKQVGLFNPKCEAYLPPKLKDYVKSHTIDAWKGYGAEYRHGAVHRIAPYLPSRTYSREDGERWQALDKEANQTLFGSTTAIGDHDRVNAILKRHQQLEREKESLGSNSLEIALTLTGEDRQPPVLMHPQLICDWGLAVELVQTFDAAMREQYGWPAARANSFRVQLAEEDCPFLVESRRAAT